MASIIWNNRINKIIITPVDFPFSFNYLSVFKYETSGLYDFLDFTKKIMDSKFHSYKNDTSRPEGIILDPLIGGVGLLDGLKLTKGDLINITNLCKENNLVNILISSFETIWYMLDNNSIYKNIILDKFEYSYINCNCDPHIILFIDESYPSKYIIDNNFIYLDYHYSFIYTGYDTCKFIESLLPKKHNSFRDSIRSKLEDALYTKNSFDIYEKLHSPNNLTDLYSSSVYPAIIN